MRLCFIPKVTCSVLSTLRHTLRNQPTHDLLLINGFTKNICIITYPIILLVLKETFRNVSINQKCYLSQYQSPSQRREEEMGWKDESCTGRCVIDGWEMAIVSGGTREKRVLEELQRCLLGRHRWALVITSQRAEWKRPWVMTRGGGRHTRFQSDWCHKHNASLQFQETVTSYKKSKSCLHCENKMREDSEREREEMKCLHDLKYQNIEL